MNQLEKGALTCDASGIRVKKGFPETKRHDFRRHCLNWLEFGIRMRPSQGTSSCLTMNVSFSLFKAADEDISFAFACSILASTSAGLLVGW